MVKGLQVIHLKIRIMIDSVYKRTFPNGDIELIINTSECYPESLDINLLWNKIVENGVSTHINFGIDVNKMGLNQAFYRVSENQTICYIHFYTVEEIKGLKKERIYSINKK